MESIICRKNRNMKTIICSKNPRHRYRYHSFFFDLKKITDQKHQNKKHKQTTSNKVVPKGKHSFINKAIQCLNCTYKPFTIIIKTNQVHVITIKKYIKVSQYRGICCKNLIEALSSITKTKQLWT